MNILVEDVPSQYRETGIRLTALLARDELFGANFLAAKALKPNGDLSMITPGKASTVSLLSRQYDGLERPRRNFAWSQTTVFRHSPPPSRPVQRTKKIDRQPS